MKREWTKGYKQAELDRAQERFGLRFPPDLVELYLERRPLDGYDWANDDNAIRQALAWPLEGLLFDMRESASWLPQWGDRPASSGEREARMRELVASAPKLIPIVGHRYLPETPAQAGNPVLSVYQSDIIYYGADLNAFFATEGFDPPWETGPPEHIRRIPFWTDFIDGDAT